MHNDIDNKAYANLIKVIIDKGLLNSLYIDYCNITYQ